MAKQVFCDKCGVRLDGLDRWIGIKVFNEPVDTIRREIDFCNACYKSFEFPLDPVDQAEEDRHQKLTDYLNRNNGMTLRA